MFTSGAGDSLGVALLLGAILQIVVLIVFFSMAGNVKDIKTRLERMEIRSAQGPRICQHCRTNIPPEAAVCRGCTREVGAWIAEAGRWWSLRNGVPFYLEGGDWNAADSAHPAPRFPDERPDKDS